VYIEYPEKGMIKPRNPIRYRDETKNTITDNAKDKRMRNGRSSPSLRFIDNNIPEIPKAIMSEVEKEKYIFGVPEEKRSGLKTID
jgi:hypothetical protein